MDCRSRISAGKNTAFSNFREKAANRSRSPDLCIRGGERLLGVAPMADFRLAPGLCTYSGGTVPELHRIVYSPPTPDRRRGHSGFDKNMIRRFRSFVKKVGGIAAKQWFVARASVGGDCQSTRRRLCRRNCSRANAFYKGISISKVAPPPKVSTNRIVP